MCVVTFDWEENDAIEKFKNFDRKRKLSWMVVEITDACNLNCEWCYANSGSGLKRDRKFMSIKDIEKVLDILSKSGIRQVTYSGGEPTIHPHIETAIRMANERGLIVHMNTNGYIFTEEMAHRMKSAGLSQVQINIDNLNEMEHDRTRGRNNSFRNAIGALSSSRKAGLTCVSQTVLTKNNESYVTEIFRFARSLGLQRCRVWDMTPAEGTANKNRHLIPTDYLSSLKLLCTFAEKSGAKNVESGDPLFPLNHETNLSVSGGKYCAGLKGMFATMSVDGDVFICATHRIPIYNIFRDVKKSDSLGIVHKKALQVYKEKISVPERCRTCSFFSDCYGGCPTRRLFNNGSDYWCPFLNE